MFIANPAGRLILAATATVVLGGEYRVAAQITPWTQLWFEDVTAGDAVVTGKRVTWHPVTLTFQGPFATETDTNPNPFLDYRLYVDFVGPSGQALRVPGFFDGDGEGGASGEAWRVRFSPDEAGLWSYVAQFDAGPEVAVSLNPNAATPTSFDGASGVVTIQPRDPQAPGFLKHGRLEHVGAHYLKFRDGSYFVRTGIDSPENFLAYRGFDNTVDQPGGLNTSGLFEGLHSYEPHVVDFGPQGLGDAQDPVWFSADTGISSRGIVGALNYLSSVGVNSIYFLPMNQGGDGRDTVPFVSYANSFFAKTHYDISKLRQWNMLFEHAQRRGILLHFVLGETEAGNENWLGGGNLTVERRLFYRELVARFSYVLGIKWNLGEENDFSASANLSFASYLQALDPYDHPIAAHSNVLPTDGSYPLYQAFLGAPEICANSMQIQLGSAGENVELWRDLSAAAGRRWLVDVDEQGPALVGLTDQNAEVRRKEVLYDVLFSGGSIEWYCGYHPLPLGGDVRLEDFRTREPMWIAMEHARELLELGKFWEMRPMDGLVTGESLPFGGAEVFALPGELYLVYYPDATATGTLDLTGAAGLLKTAWFDPRTGALIPAGNVAGGGLHVVGSPPSPIGQDWVYAVRI